MQREHVALAVGQVVERRAAVAADERLHDLRVERGAAGRDALDGVDELAHVAHAVLEQVADARRVVADELEHVRRLEVLRQHEHRDRRVASARISAAATRPSSALPGGMRTSTIATSGVYERTLSSRSSASTERPTTSWPASVEQRRDALAQQRVVVGDHDPKTRRGAFRFFRRAV